MKMVASRCDPTETRSTLAFTSSDMRSMYAWASFGSPSQVRMWPVGRSQPAISS